MSAISSSERLRGPSWRTAVGVLSSVIGLLLGPRDPYGATSWRRERRFCRFRRSCFRRRRAAPTGHSERHTDTTASRRPRRRTGDSRPWLDSFLALVGGHA